MYGVLALNVPEDTVSIVTLHFPLCDHLRLERLLKTTNLKRLQSSHTLRGLAIRGSCVLVQCKDQSNSLEAEKQNTGHDNLRTVK